NITVQLDATGNASITWRDIDDGSSDNCAIDSFACTVNPSTFTAANIGASSVTLEIADLSGNRTTCEATVTVEDKIAPTITCVADRIVNADPGACSTVVIDLAPLDASDNCPGPVISYTLSGATTSAGSNDASGEIFNIGATIVTYTITDTSYNSNSCSF